MAGAPLTAEDLYRFRWIDHVRLSPDGERVAYQVGWPDRTWRQNRSRVVVRRLLDPEPVEPTAGALRDHSPEWSPDGRKLAFISKVGPADQLFVMDLADGGPPQQLTTVAEGVMMPQWSPDGTSIAFIGRVVSDPDAVVDDPRPPEVREQLRRAPLVRVVRRLDYKHDGLGYVDGRYHHLFTASVPGGDPKQLTSGAWDVTYFDWSPDGKRFVVSGNAEPGADLQRELNLYVIDLEGNRHLFGGGFLLSSPIWSPKGDMIAFVAPNGLDAGLLERLWVVSLSGGGPRCLTADFDQAVNDSVINDMRAGHGTRVTWSTEGDRLYFPAAGSGVTTIQSVDLEGNVREEVGGQRRVYDFDVGKGVLAFCASDPTQPGELFILTGGAEAKLTDLNPWLRDRYVAQPQQEYFTAPDGWRLEGWVLKPPDHDPERLYPMVMEIHGGPHAQYGWSFFHELQVLAGMGYVVFYMNPRGSDGYGERFKREVVRDWGGKDYIDLMSSLDQLVERTGYIDADRMGVGGGSYGGFMTNWIIGQTNRFSAAVSMRSISNLVSEYAQHDIVLWGVTQLGPPPWPDLDELWRRSPIRYVQNVRTPLLLTAGEMDLRCAVSQSEEMFGALRLLGKTVELVRFPEESHDLSRNGRPDRRVERLKRIASWYQRFLGTAAIDRPAAEEATQVLPAPAEGAREWAKTIAMPRSDEAEAGEVKPVEEPTAPVEVVPEPAMTAPEVVHAEAEVLVPVVSEFATAEAPIVEPEALPQLPSVEEAPSEAEEVPTQTAPVVPISAEVEVAAPPEPAPEPEPELVTASSEPQTTQPETQPEPEPAAAVAESEAATSAFDEPTAPAQEPEPEPQPQPQPQPAWEPEPEPQAVGTQIKTPDVSSTLVAWPSNGPEAAAARTENGAPADAGAFEEATSVIPVWQQTDPNAGSKETVSLQAMPPEEVASGAAYAALLTFESGPFAGRIVALPHQMVTIGRAPDNDVVVGDPATSGHHGRIEDRSGAFWISDLGSTNGTLVNGDPVIEKQLSDGDVIAIGQNSLRFSLES